MKFGQIGLIPRIYSRSNANNIMAHKPLIVVLGATGAGKSKLAIDIGCRVNGEIINADAMQMYQGLDIVTNKVTKEETMLCPHHMIGFLSPKQQFTIVDFQKKALKLIDDIYERSKIPILVGGSNYYVESVLWDTLIKSKNTDSCLDDTNLTSSVDEFRKRLYEMSANELHKELQSIDPELAKTTHPKDKRKVIRGLEVYYQTGKLMSDHLLDQRQKSGGSNIGGPLRFHHACILWVQCEGEILCDRIHRRVDKMMSKGLLQELAEFHADYNKERLKANLEGEYENGIFQSIGFKEFHEYLTCADVTESKKEALLSAGIERMKLSTWQYAKYQAKWIKKRIVNHVPMILKVVVTTVNATRYDLGAYRLQYLISEANTGYSCLWASIQCRGTISLPVYGLDGSDPTNWQELVVNPALRIIRYFYSNILQITSNLKEFDVEESLIPLPLEKQQSSSTQDDRSYKKCDICEGKLIVTLQWEEHLKSKKHKRRYGLLKKKRTETVRILEKREKQLSEIKDENFERSNIDITESIEKNSS